MKLSIVIPVYNGSETIDSLVDTVKTELRDMDIEIVLVNDGSRDKSEEICQNLAYESPSVKFVSLRNNFGEHNAVLCGLNICTGDYAVIIDDDFQNPPSEIKKLLRAAVVGNYDIVYSKYANKKHNFFRNLGSRINNSFASYILDKPHSLYLSSFKLIKRDVINEIIKYKGPYPYIDGLILMVTRNIGVHEVEHHSRKSGTSNYTLKKLISLYLNMLINHSLKPLRLFMLIGVALFLMGISLTVFVMTDYMVFGANYSSWAYLTILIETLSGLQLLFMGIIGEFLSKKLATVSGFPQYVIKTSYLHESKKSAYLV